MTNEASAIENLSPAEIDAELARLWKIEQKARYWAGEARFLAPQRIGTRLGADYLAQAEKNEAIADAARAEARPYEAEFVRRGGWTRYFLVTNDNGHVHAGMNCSTCFPSTQFAWLVELAGKTAAEMVAEFGEMACTVCFPSAPTMRGFGDGTSTQARRTAAEVEARAAEKARKAAEKAAKAITAPDGSPLRIGYDVIRTKVAAQRRLAEAVQNLGWYGETHPSNFVREIADLAAALGAAGIDVRPIIKRAKDRAIKDGANKFPAGVA